MPTARHEYLNEEEQYLDIVLNPYSGDEVEVNRTVRINNSSYHGTPENYDILYFLSLADALIYGNNSLGQQNLTEIDRIMGSSKSDIIILSHESLEYGDIEIISGKGNDLIWDNAGNSILKAQDGDDIVHGGPGNDKIYGGAGQDHLNGGTGLDELYGEDDNDILKFTADNTWSAVTLGQSSRFIVMDAGDPENPLTLGKTLRVPVTTQNQSHDFFDGGTGNDLLELTNGNDLLALHNSHTPFPGDPNSARIKNIEFIDAMGGDDVIDLSSRDLLYGNVWIFGGDGNDVIFDNAGDSLLAGEAGNDILDGNSGDDILDGGDGNDTLFGRAGNDLMEGGRGTNTIYMGRDADTVLTDLGNDTLIYDFFDDMVDAIYGFETTGPGKDILDISNILVGYDALTDAIADFVALGTDGEGNTTLLVNQDGDAGGAFTQIAFFTNNLDTTIENLINNAALVV